MHDIHASSNPKYSSAYREIPRVYNEGSWARGGRHNAIRDKFSRCIAAWGSLVSSQNGGGIKKLGACIYFIARRSFPRRSSAAISSVQPLSHQAGLSDLTISGQCIWVIAWQSIIKFRREKRIQAGFRFRIFVCPSRPRHGMKYIMKMNILRVRNY